MKKIVFVFSFMLASLPMLAQVSPGDQAPDFNLKNIDGEYVSLSDYNDQKGAIVVFTCNGCPVAKAYEKRILELDEKYKPLGFPVIAINPNDPEVSPADSYKKMQELADKKDYSFPYLFDADQTVYPEYGATRTPHTYVLSRLEDAFQVEYIGAIDDNQRTGQVDEKYVENAVDLLLKGKKVINTKTRSVGCSIKFKK